MAAGNIKLEIVTPERSVVNDEAQIVMAHNKYPVWFIHIKWHN